MFKHIFFLKNNLHFFNVYYILHNRFKIKQKKHIHYQHRYCKLAIFIIYIIYLSIF